MRYIPFLVLLYLYVPCLLSQTYLPHFLNTCSGLVSQRANFCLDLTVFCSCSTQKKKTWFLVASCGMEDKQIHFPSFSMVCIACITGDLWAKWSKRGILCKVRNECEERDEGRRKICASHKMKRLSRWAHKAPIMQATVCLHHWFF